MYREPDFDALWDYSNPRESERAFRALLPAVRAANNPTVLAELLTQVARAQGLQQRFEEAHTTLDEVAEFLSICEDSARLRYLLERGRVYNSSNRQEEARPLFLEAWDTGLSAGEDFYAVDAAHMMAIVEPPERQLDWGKRAMQLAEKSDDHKARGWLGSLYNNMGWTYHELGRYQDALSTFQKGLRWQQQAGKPRETRIAAWTVARALRALGKYGDALALQEQNLQNSILAGESDGYIEEELGECLLALGRDEEAREHFVRALDLLSQDPSLRESALARLERLARLGALPCSSDIGSGVTAT